MATSTTSIIDHGVNNYYVREMLIRGLPYFAYSLFGQVTDIPRNNSNVVKWRRYTAMADATTALSESITPASTTLAKTDVTATVLWFGAYVQTSDELEVETLDPLALEISKLLGENAASTLDVLCRNVLQAGTTEQFASTATSTATVAAGMNLTADEVKKAGRTPGGNKAKP